MVAPAYPLSARDKIAPAYQLSAAARSLAALAGDSGRRSDLLFLSAAVGASLGDTFYRTAVATAVLDSLRKATEESQNILR